MNNGNQPNIVPFGKYKGQPIEVLAQDPQYVEWMVGQGWFKDKYPQFYTVIINNFSEPDETPEHNALQARFLDDEFCFRFCNLMLQHFSQKTGSVNVRGVEMLSSHPMFNHKYDTSSNVISHHRENKRDVTYSFETIKYSIKNILDRRFEHEAIDVILGLSYWVLAKHFYNDEYQFEHYHGIEREFLRWYNGKSTEVSFAIEIKPSLGDDYPAILRKVMSMKNVNAMKCVVYRDFASIGATESQVRKIFFLSQVMLISFDEIEKTHDDIYPDRPEIP